MKNIILTILCTFISFSFAQSDIKMSDTMQKKNTELKKMAVKAVDYLDNQLKLSSKQKTVLTNEYSSYANALIRAQLKNIERQNNTTKRESSYAAETKRTLAPIVMRLSEKRDAAIIKVLKAKQVKTYNKYKTLINPLTLEVRSPKAKTKK